MATYTKPIEVPRWADTTGNIVNPPSVKKDAGWNINEIPPSSFENWKSKLTGDWFKWIDERIDDGVNPDEISVLDPNTGNEMMSVSALRLKWLSAAGVEFDVTPGQVVAGRSEFDGIALEGIGSTKRIKFNGPLSRIQYDTVLDEYNFFCSGFGLSMVKISTAGIESTGNILLANNRSVQLSGSGRYKHGTVIKSLPGHECFGSIASRSSLGYTTFQNVLNEVFIPIKLNLNDVLESVRFNYRVSVVGAFTVQLYHATSFGTSTLVNVGSDSVTPVVNTWSTFTIGGLSETLGNGDSLFLVVNVAGALRYSGCHIDWRRG